MKSVNPYLYFDGRTEEAFEHYSEVFGGEILAMIRYRDFPGEAMEVAEEDLDRIAHAALPLGESNLLMATDIVPSMDVSLNVGNNVYITIEPESGKEADRLFEGLSAGGRVERPLQRTDWAEKHGICVDRFGIRWMIDYTGSVQFEA